MLGRTLLPRVHTFAWLPSAGTRPPLRCSAGRALAPL